MSKRDQELDRLLRALPRVRVSEDFTQRFLIRYRDRKSHPRAAPRLVMGVAAATAAAAVLITSLVWQQRHQAERARMEAELMAIRQEYLQLVIQHHGYRDELTQLAVLRLGGTGDSEIVLDLSDVDRLELPPTEDRYGGAHGPLFDREASGNAVALPLVSPSYTGGTI
jgi:hypothetical protein